MSEKKFNGKSQRGDLREAIADAIQSAKIALRTDFIRWKMIEIQGENGGYILKNELAVTISASGPTSEFEGKQIST